MLRCLVAWLLASPAGQPDRIVMQGVEARRANQPESACRWPPDSPQRERWLDGYRGEVDVETAW